MHEATELPAPLAAMATAAGGWLMVRMQHGSRRADSTSDRGDANSAGGVSPSGVTGRPAPDSHSADEGERSTEPGRPQMRLIEADELKQKLDRGENLKLVNALGEWEFRAKHIPGSLHFPTAKDAFRGLDPAEEIVIYCSNPSCRASVLMYRELEKRGYHNLRRFAGGIAAWEDAGYPLEGEWID
jgi:rhodanese-related sulfurtransferase